MMSRKLTRGLTAVWLLAATAACLFAAPAAGAAQAFDQLHGLRATARFDAGLYTAYCPRGARRAAGAGVRGQDAAVAPGQVAQGDQVAQGAEIEAESAGASDESFGGEDESELPSDEPAGAAAEEPVFESEGGVAEGGAVAHAASTSEAGWPAKQCLKMDKGPAGASHTLVGLDRVHNWLLGGYGNDTIIGGDSGDVIWADYHPSGEPHSQTAVIKAGNGRNVIYANDTRNYVWTGTNPHTVVHAHVSGISGVIHCQSRGIVVFLSSVSERHFKLYGCGRISHYSVGY